MLRICSIYDICAYAYMSLDKKYAVWIHGCPNCCPLAKLASGAQTWRQQFLGDSQWHSGKIAGSRVQSQAVASRGSIPL